MKTRAELVTATLEELQIIGVNETASAEDSQAVLDRMDSVFADLGARNVVLQNIASDIPDEAFDHLAAILAWRLASRFGQGGNAALMARSGEAEAALRTISRINRGTRQELRVDSALTSRRSRQSASW